MTTFRELIYMCLDEIKALSDDSYFTEDHVMFLLNKYRVALLKKTYDASASSISDSNYQTICVDLELFNSNPADLCGEGLMLRSILKVPYTLPFGKTKVYTLSYYNKEINFVSRDRMRYSGQSKYTLNSIYASIAPDLKLYLKSSDKNFLYLDKVVVTGIFEDASLAETLSCEAVEQQCDPWDGVFPIEEGLITTLIQLVVQDLLGASYRPKDDYNNASDDMSDIVSFIRRNMKSNLAKLIDGEKDEK